MSSTETAAAVRECRQLIGGGGGGGGGGGRDGGAAAEAFPAWAKTPPAARQRIFLRAADILERRQDEVVSLLARETGCSFGFGMFQMGFVPGPSRPPGRRPSPAA